MHSIIVLKANSPNNQLNNNLIMTFKFITDYYISG